MSRICLVAFNDKLDSTVLVIWEYSTDTWTEIQSTVLLVVRYSSTPRKYYADKCNQNTWCQQCLRRKSVGWDALRPVRHIGCRNPEVFIRLGLGWLRDHGRSCVELAALHFALVRGGSGRSCSSSSGLVNLYLCNSLVWILSLFFKEKKIYLKKALSTQW